MRAFSPASTVDKWRRFTLSSGFTLNVPSRTPQQMRGRYQTYPRVEGNRNPQQMFRAPPQVAQHVR